MQFWRFALRSFALVAVTLTAASVCEGPADACTSSGPGYGEPTPPNTQPGVGSFVPLDDGTSTEPRRPQPRNVALLFEATTTPGASEAFVRSQITIEVQVGGSAAPGAMKLVGTADANSSTTSLWQWLPDGAPATAIGTYHVTITNAGDVGADKVRAYDIPVEDRDVLAPQPSLTTGLVRDVVADPGSPTITCTNEQIYACAPAAPVVIPTGYAAKAGLTYQAPGFSRNDYPYLASRVRVFTRTNGVVADEQVFSDSWDLALTRTVPIDFGPADAYCVSASTWVVSDPDHPQTTEQCQPRGDLDFSVSPDEAKKHVDDALGSCTNPTFPPAYASPNGRALDADGHGSSSCSVDPRGLGARDDAGLVALGLVMLLVTSRLNRGRGPEGRADP
jgi:hypothetical protein